MKGVIYFCKAPEIGRVKTRLAKSIGDENTLEIYKTMLNNLLENSLHVKSFIAFDGNENIIPSDLPRFAQKGDGLGERMKNAFLHLFEIGFTQVILVGADIPRIDEEILQSALESLDSHDGVLSPTNDGGYYLIGFNKSSFICKAFDDDIFDNPNVYELTCKALEPLHVKHGKTLEDIDTIHDLRRFCADFPKHILTQSSNQILEKLPKISLIMPVFHEDESAVLSVSWAFENARKSDFEVIIVDTHNRTCIDELRFKNPVRLHTAPKGRANQLNAGFEIARGKTILFLHADSKLPKDWDALIEEALHVNDAGAFKLDIDSPSIWLKFIAFATNIRASLLGSPYGDQGQFFKATIFEKLGKYPPIPIMEDVAIMKSLKNSDLKLKILKQKIATSPRRWHKEGLFYTTLRNRFLSTLFALGVSPQRLAQWYQALKYKNK